MKISLPQSFKQLVQSQIPDWEAFCAAHELTPPASIRLHPKKAPKSPLLTPVPWCKNGAYLPHRPRYYMDPWFYAGVYYPQEAGSMLLDLALRQLPIERQGLKVLDMCAAPGGKSTIIMDWLDGEGFLVSNEIIHKRACILEDNLDKWGYCNRMVSNSSPTQLAKADITFDLVLVDAPCSGEGMFRKEPNALQMWSEETVKTCSQRQNEILDKAVQCLRPGGYLIYSTCTYNRHENEEVIARFVENSGAKSVPLNLAEEWHITSEEGNGYGYHCYPHLTRSEGFFISVLKMPGEKSDSSTKKKTASKNNKPSKPVADLGRWLKHADRFTTIEHRGRLFFYPKEAEDFVNPLIPQIHVLSIGQFAGKLIRGELAPAAELALSLDLNKENFQRISFTDQQALAYLTRTSLNIDDCSHGLLLCEYREIPIGWAKNINGKFKNKWPKEWQIMRPQGDVENAI